LNYRLHFLREAGAAPRGGLRRGTVPPTPHKGHFCKSPRTDEKKLGIWGGDVTNHIWISAWVCHKWFSKTGSNLYFIQLLFITDVLNLFICLLK